jgi:oxygen-independent coproporphyrinogen-3 oxidase
VVPAVVEHAYVHVPFCPTICPFCSFEVLERRASAVDAYLERLDHDAAAAADRCELELRTIYLGGGTPSYLRDAELERLCDILRTRLGWATEEVTLEIHPSTVTPDRVTRWVDLGFTRLSVGVESTDDAVLARLGRSHGAAAAMRSLQAALASGLDVSADVMTAIDGQDVRADLERVAGEGVGHVSAYVLTIEDGTPFARDEVRVDADAEAEALDAADVVLGRAGLRRYEVSNHARPGQECRHNLAYWDNRCWIGLGPGAHGHEPTNRAGGADEGAITVRRAQPGFASWLEGEEPELDARTPEGWLTDAMIAGLRRTSGVDLAELSARSGIDAASHFAPAIDEVVTAGLATLEGTGLRATTGGFRVLDQVAAAFVP